VICGGDKEFPRSPRETLAGYVLAARPRNRVVYHWFDVYDLEEEQL
jgi:hypothetical protein